MSQVLVTTGSTSPVMQFDTAKPFQLRFVDAGDIKMPFDGTIVIPGDPAIAPNFAQTGFHDFLFLSLKFPFTTTEGGSPARSFSFLKDVNNRSVVTNKNVLFLVANDHSLLNDFHITRLFSDLSDVYDPVFKENYILSNIPRYIMIEFDEGSITARDPLPIDITPFTCDKGFSLKTNHSGDGGIERLRQAMAAATLTGTIRSFDLSGRETETYSSMLFLEEDPIYIADVPDDDAMKIQFVDIHGEPLGDGEASTLSKLVFNPPVTSDNSWFNINFGGEDRQLKIRLLTPPSGVLNVHDYKFHQVAIWPGYQYLFREIESDSADIVFDLKKGMETSDSRKFRFVRICIFQPLKEFQTEVGGDIEIEPGYAYSATITRDLAKFKDNKFLCFTRFNLVSIYNCGADFFRDYYNTVITLGQGDRLYQCNWSANPFIHLLGSMDVRNIEANSLDKNSVLEQLKKLSTDFIIQPVMIQSKDMSDPELRAVFIPSTINGGTVFSDSIFIEVWTRPGAAEFRKMTYKGFIRKNELYALLLLPDLPEEGAPVGATGVLGHQLIAFWKNNKGMVQSVTFEDFIDAGIHTILPIDPAADVSYQQKIELSITNDDPPLFNVTWTDTIASLDDILNGLSPGMNANSSRLLVINLSAGGTYFLPLNPIVVPEALQQTFSAEDEVLFAFTKIPAGTDDLLEPLLISPLWFGRYPHNSFQTGNVPMHPRETSGLFRTAIKNKVELRAMYWEQYLAAFSPNDDLARGISTNAAVTALINRAIDGERGFAFQDRSTRDFGSWHQKSSFIMQKDPDIPVDPPRLLVSYLGGMDLTMGRYDTQLHFARDPDRQGGAWYDTHTKIIGEASLDVFKNFKHRWKAIKAFADAGMKEFRPVNITSDFTTEEKNALDLLEPGQFSFPIPDDSTAFVQINRTLPPYSSFSLPNVSNFNELTIAAAKGEMGSRASYFNAIKQARRFIIINEQYFFSQEIAYLLHQRLLAPNGPDFLILLLPEKLDESVYIDPHLYRVRKLALQTLWYGATAPDPDTPPESLCGKYQPFTEATTTENVKNKVAVITPINHENSGSVYVHSKHMIVDDVWMTIGSANMGNRSLTYDGEINAAMVGTFLYKAGTDVVRNHRIKVCRQLLGVPEAYSALLQDAYASFRLFKAIEGRQNSPGFQLHPAPLHFKWLDPDFVTRVNETAFDDNVDKAALLDFHNEGFAFLSCNILDPDGRSLTPSQLGAVAALAGVGKTVPSARADINVIFSAAADAVIRPLIQAAVIIHLSVAVRIAVDINQNPFEAGPFTIHEYNVKISDETNNLFLEGRSTNIVSVPISVTEKYTFLFKITNESVTPTVELLAPASEIIFDPVTASPVITNGSERVASITIE